MKRLLLATIALASLSIYSAGCNLTAGSSNQRLGENANGDPIACTTDADCPTGFECEVEAEHGTTTSLCKAHDEAEAEGADDNASTGTGVAGTACATSADCGAGLECEVEVEHGVTTATCKAHGGTATDDTTGAGADDSAGGADDTAGAGTGADDSAGGADDTAGTGTGAGAIGAACATDADCSAGLECEVEVEHGVTTATCQEHKSGKV